MDKVLHFLLIIALVLIIVCCVIWLLGLSCFAGYFQSDQRLTKRAQKHVDNIGETATQFLQEARQELKEVADEVKTRIQDIRN